MTEPTIQRTTGTELPRKHSLFEDVSDWPQVIPFDRCYNATTCFESKSKMPTLPIEDIKVNDLVVMEVNVGRYSTAKDSNNANGPQRPQGKDKFKQRNSFAEWKPTFDLLNVSLLCAAPDDPAEAAMEDAPDADVSI